jgi:protein-S-isoprenylcysteine O-methyltransferase Ste14
MVGAEAMFELMGIAGAWIAYGALHTWLAAHSVKHWVEQHWPTFWPAYRLLFNLLAVALLLPLLWITYRYDGAPLWRVPSIIAWPALAIALAGFAWSMKWYDGATFLGLRQWRDRVGPDAECEAFTLSPLHRHVRHPWYTLGLLVLWTRDLNAAWLMAAIVVTIYLAIGSRLEENKLIALYGSAYRRYRRRVPGLLPIPGRSLSKEAARMLESQAHQDFHPSR